MEQTHDVVASDPGSVIEAGPVAEAERPVGTVEELWRYPVKSMLGGKVSELVVTEQGGLGDRAWALRDQQLTDVVPAFRVPLTGEVRVRQLVHQARGAGMWEHYAGSAWTICCSGEQHLRRTLTERADRSSTA